MIKPIAMPPDLHNPFYLNNNQITVITPHLYHSLVFNLASQLLGSNQVSQYRAIVGLSHGGSILAADLSRLLMLPVFLVHPKSTNPDLWEQVRILNEQAPMSDKRFLFVDEISDTGSTLRKLFHIVDLEIIVPADVATLIVRSTTTFRPKFFVQEVSYPDWLHFWWEPEYYSTLK